MDTILDPAHKIFGPSWLGHRSSTQSRVRSYRETRRVSQGLRKAQNAPNVKVDTASV